MSVRPGQGVVVRAPAWAPAKAIDDFVRANRDWALQRLAVVPPEPPQPTPLTDGSAVHLGGATLALRIGIAGRPSVQAEGETLELLAPQPDAATARRALGRFFRQRTAAAVTDALARWTPVVGRSPERVIIKDQQGRWGSCTGTVLRFNWRLAAFAQEIVDYVVVHELCHLIHPDHSARFWGEVARVLPDFKERRNALKSVGTGFPFGPR